MKEHTEMHWSMADVAGKTPSRRVAIAGGRIDLGRDAFELLQAGRLPKGDPLAMAGRVADAVRPNGPGGLP